VGTRLWEYFVPYQPDLERVLHDLRQQVFNSGDYYLYIDSEPANENAYIGYAYDLGIETPEEEEQARQYFRDEQRKNPKAKPGTIAEVVDWCGEWGTQSIIDIKLLSDDPECADRFTAIPLSETQLLNVFGTTKPTHSMITKKTARPEASSPMVASYLRHCV
jgi:hypothetical protein